MLFGRAQQPADKTVLILDIESGSVGMALAKRSETGELSILNELRAHLPATLSRSAEALAADTQKLVRQMLPDFGRTAHQQGGVSNIAAFLAPPWGKPNLVGGRPDFAPHMQDVLRRELLPYFTQPVEFFTNAGAAASGLRAVSPYEDKYLLCIVTHEMTELLLINGGAVAGHATIPHGINLPLRTLRAHGGLSDAEARSALKLGHIEEPLNSAAETFARDFFAAGRELFEAGVPSRVWVVSTMGDYFARALSHPSLSGLFVQGGEVRALRPQHALPLITGPGSTDLFIVLETVFILYS